MFKYIEIVEYGDNQVAKRMDVSHKSDRMIEKIEDGIMINLNHDEFYVQSVETDEKLDVVG